MAMFPLVDSLLAQPQLKGMDRGGVPSSQQNQAGRNQNRSGSTFEKTLERAASKDSQISQTDLAAHEAARKKEWESTAKQAEKVVEEGTSSTQSFAEDRQDAELKEQDAQLRKIMEMLSSIQGGIGLQKQFPDLDEKTLQDLENLIQGWKQGHGGEKEILSSLQNSKSSLSEELRSLIRKMKSDFQQGLSFEDVKGPSQVEEINQLSAVERRSEAKLASLQNLETRVESFVKGEIAPHRVEPNLNRQAADLAPSSNEKKNPLLVEEQNKAGALKDLTSGLFVQKSLSSQFESNLIHGQQFIAKQGPKLDMSFSSSLRTNLLEDMKGFVTQQSFKLNGGEISLKLRPGNLGEVRVLIQTDHDVVRLQMQAEKPMAEQILKSQASELKVQLNAAGLKVDELQISQQGRSQMSQDGHQERGFSFREDQRQDSQRNGSQEPRDENEHDQNRSFDEFHFESVA